MNRKQLTTAIAGAALAAAAAAFVYVPTGSARSQTVTNGRIAFQSARSPGDQSAPDIYTIDPDGSNTVGPLTTGYTDGQPAFSPDGTKIAFSTFEFAGSPCCNSIAVMNADGSGHAKVINGDDTHSGVNGSPAWSPDGQELAFVSTFGRSTSQIGIVGVDGGGLTQITTGTADSFDPAWSPDGARIAFDSNPSGNSDIYTMKTDGTDVQQLTSDSENQFQPAWSPDGTKIAYTNNQQIVVMNADGSNPVQLTNVNINQQPAWSPDGTKIAFMTDRDHDYEIYTMNADGSSPTRVTNSPSLDEHPSWGTAPIVGGGPDSTPPTVTITLTSPNDGTPNGFDGWFTRSPVAGTVSADDTATGGSNISALDCGSIDLTTSGLGTPTASGTFSIADQGTTHISCTASDSAGNTSSPAAKDVKLDMFAPVADHDPAIDYCETPGNDGWCRGQVAGGFQVTDAVSGVTYPLALGCAPGATCTFQRPIFPSYGLVAIDYGEVCDDAGNCACAASDPGRGGPCTFYYTGTLAHFKADGTVPQASRNAAADSCSLAGDNGWCRGTQTAGFRAYDEMSGAVSPCTAAGGVSCGFTRSSSTQGAAVTIPSGQVCDDAGNCISGMDAGPFKIDSTAPTLAPTLGPSPILLHGTASATPNATDATSGVASQTCDAVKTSTVGVHTLTCTARDNAGNVSSATVSYLVEYKLLGFLSPPSNSKLKRGSTVLIRIALADVHGTRIPDAEAAGLLSPVCRVTFGASGAQSARACVTYNTRGKEFHYGWKLGQQTGNVTISVTVTYPGTASTTVLSEPISVTN